MIHIEIDALPPTLNHMYEANRGGGRRLSGEALAWRDRVFAAAHQRDPARRLPAGDLALTMHVVFASKRRADLDNRIKAALDALQIAYGFDDVRVARIVATREYGALPMCALTLEAL